MKIIELFGGIGACSAALKRLGIDYEIADYVEIDKYAVASYNAINGTNFEPQDITKWDKDFKDIDLIMHGSPCQDFSLAGKNKGGDQNSGTRSSLMYETLRIVSKIKPKYVVWENVKNLLSEKHRHNFDNYLNEMSKIGYYNFYSVLNAKDYGIPQNRERVFTVSIRKDLNVAFEFPKPYSLEKRLKDFLEPHVDEKYFLSEKMLNCLNGLSRKTKKGYTEAQDGDGVYINRPHQKRGVVQKGMIQTIKTSPDIGVVVKNEIMPKLIGGICGKNSNGGTQWYQQNRIYDSESIAMAHPANLPGGSYKYLVNILPLRIRKLTPKECWRLMGFNDDEYEKPSKFNSTTQLYKQAGNSIVVNVLMEIFKNLLLEKTNNETIVQLSIFDFI